VLQESGVGGDTDEELEFLVCRAEPEEGDEDGKDDGTHGIDPPCYSRAKNTGHQTEAIDEEIVAMVFPEDADLAVLVAKRKAVDEQSQFRAESDANGDDGGVVEAHVVVFLGEFADGHDDEDQGDGGHEEAEGDVAGGFETCFA
jgi:hypothetical protein